MKLAVLRESAPGERRVALVPDVAMRLVEAGHQVAVESDAGRAASFPDAAYAAAGATLCQDAGAAEHQAAAVLRVQAPTPSEAERHPEGAALVSFFDPGANREALGVLARRRADVFSFDRVPRTSRAQAVDALSSQATVSGYRAALCAADALPKFFPMFMTSAGTVPPAKVLVLGAGVAGLQAIATARRLGAAVRAYDVRAAAREEIASLGATFVELASGSAEGSGGYARELSDEELRRLTDALGSEVAASDAVITTAAVPGRPAPVLVTGSMVERMAPGSVVVDMAADSGGNCELSEAGRRVLHGSVAVIGLRNPASLLPTHASFLYARNTANLLALLSNGTAYAPDFEDDIVAGTCLLRQGVPLAEAVGGAAGAAGAAGEDRS